MAIITVKSQEELDWIPLDTEGTIRIEFGTADEPAVLRNRYKHRVRACDNSSVEAYGNSSVEACDNSSVRAYGNVQVVDFLQGARIQLSGNARTVYTPRNIKEYMTFYGVEHDDTFAVFYKAVHKSENRYFSNYDSSFEYKVGKTIKAKCFDDDECRACADGIHMSHQAWALDFGRGWDNLAILEVKARIKDIVVPIGSDGKVRAPEVEVIREVPLEECGVLGKILLKKRAVKA